MSNYKLDRFEVLYNKLFRYFNSFKFTNYIDYQLKINF